MHDAIAQSSVKLDRARQTIIAVQAGIDAYHASNPYAFRTERLTDPHRLELHVESVRAPPLQLGVLIGEFVHNLRSALDQLVWSLALTRVEAPYDRLQFPIHDTPPRDWGRIVRDRLRDVPADAVDRIWRAQPFHGDRPEINALTVVRELSNVDKHRVIHGAVSVPVEPSASNFTVQTNDVADDILITSEWGAPLVPGMIAATVEFTPTGPRPQVHVAGHMPTEAVFGSIGFRAAAMPGVVDAITALIRSFDGHFK